MLFTTIEPAADLSPAARRRVARSGPSAVLVRTGYPGLLATAGFADVEQHDITSAYRSTQLAWIDATIRRSEAIGRAMGSAALEARIADRRRALAAIDDGLLRRTRYIASRRATGAISP